MSIVTIRMDITWEGVPKDFGKNNKKEFKRTLKEMTGASDIEVIDWHSWDEEDEDY